MTDAEKANALGMISGALLVKGYAIGMLRGARAIRHIAESEERVTGAAMAFDCISESVDAWVEHFAEKQGITKEDIEPLRKALESVPNNLLAAAAKDIRAKP